MTYVTNDVSGNGDRFLLGRRASDTLFDAQHPVQMGDVWWGL